MNTVPRFLKACRGEPVDKIPAWLMRQAGRYLPEYRNLREKHSFMELCKTPALAVEITLQPVERFRMDAAILFSDILFILESMGANLKFDENHGPRLAYDVSQRGGEDGLRVPDPERDLGFVLETIRQLRGALDDRTALIGFSGAPFTLASYLIEGGSSRTFFATKSFMYRNTGGFHRLMGLLSDAVALYLQAQIDAGAQAVQIFDTWAGILSPGDYREYVLPYMQRILESLPGNEVPTIHYSLGTSTLLDEMKQMGAGVMGLDWKVDIGRARERLGPAVPVQGNMDPFALFQNEASLETTLLDILAKGSAMPGYIFNLGHGIHQKTPVESVYRMKEIIDNFSLLPAPSEGGQPVSQNR